jgi:HEPN domain-containing protein/predicted nucleotidyltransferase
VNNELLFDIRIVLEGARLSFNVSGALLFGSMAMGEPTPSSDYDLLIIGDGINPKRHRRGDEIILLKQCLPSLPFDILLFTPQEVTSNFKNHNPLFLDIAEDGIIILDKNNFIKTLIRETRNYTRTNGINRVGGAWRFPVKQGVATYLSNVSNKDFALSMLKDGERDFLIGKKLIEENFYDKSVYHFQQSVEKCIKAVLISIGIFQKTHFVGQVLKKSLSERDIPEPWTEKLLKIASISDGIEPEVSLSRYPGIIDDNLWLPYEEYQKIDAENAGEKAEETMLVTKDFLQYWFSDSQ